MKYDAVAVVDGDDDLALDGDDMATTMPASRRKKEGTKMTGKIVVLVVAPLLGSADLLRIHHHQSSMVVASNRDDSDDIHTPREDKTMAVEENGDVDDLDDNQEEEDHLDNQMAVLVVVVPHGVDILPHVPVVLLHRDCVEADMLLLHRMEGVLLHTIQDEAQ